ncbi:putative membrane protein [Octadecabacter temperatus]|uniref:Uncharacterized protein n=1 Tax=Octadecabacter temperatus TaxID=1458307 RepID=A0A0K0Y1N9_9RHOB|nr:DUF1304 domain-containing protein [Octadecabacter temperatus]AKS44817.1 hypothetical protein OSB_02490 [Octadecabacter temperatus]SIO34925.1 putative membrane protein [Octadecabacter temperatus]
MRKIGLALTGLIALLHLYIAWLEIFAWTTRAPSVFDAFPATLFEPTVALAANQGVYNLFLAAGLIWALLIKDKTWQFNVAAVFLGFVAIAGAVAAGTIAVKTGLPQLVPAAIALVCLGLSRKSDRV